MEFEYLSAFFVFVFFILIFFSLGKENVLEARIETEREGEYASVKDGHGCPVLISNGRLHISPVLISNERSHIPPRVVPSGFKCGDHLPIYFAGFEYINGPNADACHL